MTKTVLLTGATGFLGSRLLEALQNKDYRVVILKRSASDVSRIINLMDHTRSYDADCDSLESVFEDQPIDIVLHCATSYGRKQESPIDLLDTNLMLPVKLLFLAIRYKCAAFINTDTLLGKNVSAYALSKSQFLEWLHFQQDQIQTINVAIEHFYGPGDDRTKFTTFIVRSLLEDIDNLDLTTGEQKRDFIFIDDVVSAFMTILSSADGMIGKLRHYEIGTGQTTSVRKFVELAKELTSNTTTYLNFGAIPYRGNEAMDVCVDLEPLMTLGWRAQSDLQSGLEKTINCERGK